MFENDSCKMWLEDGIVTIQYKENAVLDLPLLKTIVKNRIDLAENIPRPILLEPSKGLYWTKEAKAYGAKKEALLLTTAWGIVNSNTVVMISINSFLTFYKPLVPVKIFSEREKAIRWLQKFKQQLNPSSP